jgi:outer membrane immunogenic protein
MIRNLGWALAAAVSLAGLGAASAADMAVKARPVPPPVVSWTGCYVGVNGGYTWGDGYSDLALQPSLAAWTALSPGYAVFDGRYAKSPNGALGGAQGGCNVQFGSWVIGFEADADYVGASNTTSRSAVVLGLPTQGTVTHKLDWLSSVRARLGFAPTPNWLLYATGGVAFGTASYSARFVRTDLNPNVGFFGDVNDEFKSGWIAGAGAEYMITPSWTVRGEYLYYDLGTTRVVGLPFNQVANGFGADGFYATRGSIARVGLSYKFGWGGPVVAKY